MDTNANKQYYIQNIIVYDLNYSIVFTNFLNYCLLDCLNSQSWSVNDSKVFF